MLFLFALLWSVAAISREEKLVPLQFVQLHDSPSTDFDPLIDRVDALEAKIAPLNGESEPPKIDYLQSDQLPVLPPAHEDEYNAAVDDLSKAEATAKAMTEFANEHIAGLPPLKAKEEAQQEMDQEEVAEADQAEADTEQVLDADKEIEHEEEKATDEPPAPEEPVDKAEEPAAEPAEPAAEPTAEPTAEPEPASAPAAEPAPEPKKTVVLNTDGIVKDLEPQVKDDGEVEDIRPYDTVPVDPAMATDQPTLDQSQANIDEAGKEIAKAKAHVGALCSEPTCPFNNP
jgi:hypothetical protein